jgi:hypothetical protein
LLETDPFKYNLAETKGAFRAKRFQGDDNNTAILRDQENKEAQ